MTGDIILFHDGILDDTIYRSAIKFITKLDYKPAQLVTLNGSIGYKLNRRLLIHKLKTFDKDICVLTNATTFLNNNYAWDNETGKPNIFILTNNEWKNIENLTDKDITKDSNIELIYLSDMV